ncbi:putative multi-sensor signal transduction histidine kinase [Megalodesulfovibrio gigas DSM 1382 = ATCC 19364]|uniref:histidine kinase n=2 Tax=Megalodesulfovibrio gigas TaxID=879 RepID=T2GFF0_MEGG1|nr:putative multi-sensor signal transduction histidine kinase [Megalodesulfovibrio gigas DSM 1382 = ATCC 19364]
MLLAVLLGAGLARVLTVPVRRLTQAARRVAAGDLAAAAPVTGLDEVGELGQAFNAMTERLVRRLEIELLVAQISRRCLESGLGETSAAAEAVLAMLGQFLAADSVFTVMRGTDRGAEHKLRLAHEWRADGTPAADAARRASTIGQYGWLLSKLRGTDALRVADVQSLPPPAGELRQVLQAEGLRSFMAVPVASSSGMRGALVAGVMWGRRAFQEEESTLLAMAAEMLGTVLERNAALGALKASEERYALAQKAANIGSWEWDIPSGRLFWSDAIAPMFGMQPGEFAGTYKSFLERVHPDDRKLVLDAVGASFRHGVGYNVEHRILHANGSERWVAEAGEVSRDARGRPERMRGILQDITERKWAEEALARLNRRLEQLVEARTRDLGQKAVELETANVRLLELDQMKTSFLTSVSHELRTPLTSILGFAKLIAKDFSRHFQGLAGDEGRLADRGRRILDNLEIIGLEGERLTRLINDLLDLAKIESGKMDWRDARIAPDTLVTQAVRAVSSQFAQKPDVRLVVEIAPALPELMVDPDRVTQVLINLLHNAIKFTTHGQVRLEAGMPRAGVLQLRVEDTGQGIHLADLERIFDKFYQVAGHDTRVAKPAGTGLGLAICRQIVEHYKGAIWAESAWGQGSAFIVELPVPDLEAAA